jgi:hypothetical protein
MRRSFWVALGLGAGATGAVVTSRWARRQAKKVAPTTIAREAKGGLLDLGKLVSESIAEGRRAMADREEELRTELLADPPPREPADAGPSRRSPAP